jgi:adenosylcobinamide-phosphate guanylyltransferase
MCGGRGSRLDAAVEKPLYEVAGRPMVDRVLDALAASRLDRVHAVSSPHAPRTHDHLEAAAREAGSPLGEGSVVEAPGEGYVADLGYALDRVGTPALTVAADLPLLAGDAVDDVLDAFSGTPVTVEVPAALKRQLGVSVDTARSADGREFAPTGVNVVADGADDETLVTYDARLAVNVNRPPDVRVAEALL